MIKNALLITLFISAHSFAQDVPKDTCKTKSCEYKIYYYPNGRTKEEGYLIHGRKEGVWKEYTENRGRLLFQWTYLNSTKHGNYFYFENNGKVSAAGKYKDGLLSDTLKYFDDKGNLEKEEVWLANYKSKSSSLVYTKNYSKESKPDNTVEIINGKKFLWINGTKHELITNDSINKMRRR